MPLVPVAEWRPDIGSVNAMYTANISNVLPVSDGYGPIPQCDIYSDALAADPLGGFVAKDTSGSVHIFIGTATKLYKLSGTSWDDVTRTSGGDYSASANSVWDFEQFGDYVVAVNSNDDPQVYQMNVSSDFAALGGSPPRSNYVRAWGDYLALMNQTSDATKLSWCDTNDITNWSTGVSDSQIFPDGGVIIGSTRATNPILFLERAIYYGTFVPGSSITFTFTKIHDGLGAKSARGVCQRGAYIFFNDEGSFHQIAIDGSIQDIGYEKVDRFFFDLLTASDNANIIGTVDPFYSRAYWSGDLAGAGTFDTILIYDWNLQRWSQASISHKFVFAAATPGYTLEGLDAVSASIEDLESSLDAKIWQAGAPVLAFIDNDNKLCFLSGPSAAATIESQEIGAATGQLTLIDSIKFIVDTNDYSISVGSRTLRGDTVTYSSNLSPSSVTGRVDRMHCDRFHRVLVEIPDSTVWTTAQSFDVSAQPAGFR